MTTEQARSIIWARISDIGLSDVACQIGKTERALRYFGAGGLLSKETVTALQPLMPDLGADVWLAVLGVEWPTHSQPQA